MRKSAWLWVGGSVAGVLWACSNDTFNGGDGGDAQGADVTNTDAISGGGDSGGDVITKPRWCLTQDAAFCADFDIPNDAGAGFTSYINVPPDSFGFQDAMVTSGLGGVGLIPGDGGSSSAFLTTTVGTAVARMHLELDVYLPALGSAISTPNVFAFAMGALGPPAFGLAETAKRWVLATEDSSSPQNFDTDPPITGGWFHAVLTIAPLAVTGGSVTLVLTDSMNTYTATMPNVPTVPTPTGPYEAVIQIGVSNNYPAPNVPLTFYYDQVVVYLK